MTKALRIYSPRRNGGVVVYGDEGLEWCSWCRWIVPGTHEHSLLWD